MIRVVAPACSTCRAVLYGITTPTALDPPSRSSATTTGLDAAEAIWERQRLASEDEVDKSGLQGLMLDGLVDTTNSTGSSKPNPHETENDGAVKQDSLLIADDGAVPEDRAFQLHHRYLVVETQGGIEVIDQHALRESAL